MLKKFVLLSELGTYWSFENFDIVGLILLSRLGVRSKFSNRQTHMIPVFFSEFLPETVLLMSYDCDTKRLFSLVPDMDSHLLLYGTRFQTHLLSIAPAANKMLPFFRDRIVYVKQIFCLKSAQRVF